MTAFDQPGSASFIRSVTDFVFIAHEPAPCDIIFVPGSARPQHVDKAAEMYLAGYAPLLLPSGRFGIGSERFLGDPAFDTEWSWMRSLLLQAGVPDSAILREDRSTYTWENAQFSRQVTDAAAIRVKRAMLCCKSYHARRALLYYQAAYPETEFLVCPAEVTGLSRNDWYLSPEGRQHVLGEVRRLGDQVNEVFEQLLMNERR